MPINLELCGINLILNALEEYPYNRVSSIIQHITEQREVVS